MIMAQGMYHALAVQTRFYYFFQDIFQYKHLAGSVFPVTFVCTQLNIRDRAQLLCEVRQ